MATIVTAPESIAVEGFKVFLGGAIDMGKAENWQSEVIELLGSFSDLVLLNPRRAEFTTEMEDEQIRWELRALDTADAILMWFPKESEAPISLLEFGLYLQSGKLLVGVEDGFYRQRNIELTAEYYRVEVSHSLQQLTSRLSAYRQAL